MDKEVKMPLLSTHGSCHPQIVQVKNHKRFNCSLSVSLVNNIDREQLSAKHSAEQVVGHNSTRFEFADGEVDIGHIGHDSTRFEFGADGEVDIGAWDKTSLLASQPVCLSEMCKQTNKQTNKQRRALGKC